jgi:peptidoglycan hydrolase-like protein with peptidoglycan-binding domain
MNHLTRVVPVIISTTLFALPFAATAQSENQPPPAGFCPQLSQTLTRGMRDATTVPQGQVTELQKFLVGYYDLDPGTYISGYFGRLTQANVIRFQREQNLPAYGYLGSFTRTLIGRVCGAAAGAFSSSSEVSFSASQISGPAPLQVIFNFSSDFDPTANYRFAYGDQASEYILCYDKWCRGSLPKPHTYVAPGTYNAILQKGNGCSKGGASAGPYCSSYKTIDNLTITVTASTY